MDVGDDQKLPGVVLRTACRRQKPHKENQENTAGQFREKNGHARAPSGRAAELSGDQGLRTLVFESR